MVVDCGGLTVVSLSLPPLTPVSRAGLSLTICRMPASAPYQSRPWWTTTSNSPSPSCPYRCSEAVEFGSANKSRTLSPMTSKDLLHLVSKP